MKKILVWLLVLTMVVGVFAGCKPQTETPETTLSTNAAGLEKAMDERPGTEDYILLSKCYADKVIPAMNNVRTAVDGAEVIISPDLWPVPAYGDLLFSV